MSNLIAAQKIIGNPTILGKPVNLIRTQTLARKLEGAKILGTIPVTIKRYITDVDGVVLTKASGLIPAALQISYPVYFLCDFDRQGGYKIGGLSRPPLPGSYFVQSYIKGNFVNPLTDFSGLNTVNNFINNGDLVQLYTDNLTAPNYFIFIVHSMPYAGWGSILSDTESNDTQVDSISYYASVLGGAAQKVQFEEPLLYVTGKVIGNYLQNAVQPLIFKDPQVAQNDFIDLLVAFDMSKYFGINFYMRYATDVISMNLKVKHI